VDVLDSLNSRGDLSGEDLATERWDYLGVGRDDGCEAGEFSPIFFKRDVWRKMTGSEETVWLNETGEVGKKGWDAGSVRILVCVVLEDVDVRRGKKGKRVLLMNTHLDDQGRRSREESARIILRELKDRSERWDVDAVVLGGDFNSETDGDAYPIIANFEESGVVDVRMLAEGEQVYGEENTFTGFDGRGDGEELKRIDFLFLGTRKEDNFFDLNTPAYAVLPNRFEDGVYLSDHRAVVADLVI
jgi:endonuclease/exonuclease/phosphatase family metal-dependent hydrolase